MGDMPSTSEQPGWLVRLLAGSRFIMVLAVVGGFLGALLLLVVVTFELVSEVWEALFIHGELGSGELKVVLIDSMDTYLVATVLFLISMGLYQLFIDSEIPLPVWLQTRSVDDLEKRLAGMVITVLSVIFLTEAVQWKGGQDILWYGLAIGAVILGISAFLYQEGRHSH
jgi:uncharacterized membrane protein YqhA